jgi:transposase
MLPENMNDWLPENHPAWFFIDAVKQLDLTEFYGRYRTGAQGRAAYDPEMMVTLLLYAYAHGIRSSREIERRIEDNAAFRIITSDHLIDHATICRFRKTHLQELEDLFVQVVGACVSAGMVRTTIVAIDGTKIAANASQAANATDEQLRKLAAKVFAEAEATDEQEDGLYGDRRGDEIPEELLDPAARIDYLRDKLAGQKPPKDGSEKKINKTDPDSRVMKTADSYVQGYNAQLAVSEDQVVVAADLTDEANDVRQLEPMIRQTEDNLEVAGAAPVKTFVADAGYLSAANAAIDTDAELLIAPTKRGRLDEMIAGQPSDTSERPPRPPQRDHARRTEVIEAYVSKRVTASEAAQELFIPITRVYFLAWHLRKFGSLPEPMAYRPPDGPSASEIMLARLADPEARATYKRRSQIVEPVIGHIKDPGRLRKFVHRGRAACRCELKMTATARNLLKILVFWRHSTTSAVAT